MHRILVRLASRARLVGTDDADDPRVDEKIADRNRRLYPRGKVAEITPTVRAAGLAVAVDDPGVEGEIADRGGDRRDAREQGIADRLHGKAEAEEVESADELGADVDPVRSWTDVSYRHDRPQTSAGSYVSDFGRT